MSPQSHPLPTWPVGSWLSLGPSKNGPRVEDSVPAVHLGGNLRNYHEGAGEVNQTMEESPGRVSQRVRAMVGCWGSVLLLQTL